MFSVSLLPQDKEKGNDCEGTDQPINLSNQCTINGQTIIEHIIENILDEPMPQGKCHNLGKERVVIKKSEKACFDI
jgi:hypothetical protein